MRCLRLKNYFFLSGAICLILLLILFTGVPRLELLYPRSQEDLARTTTSKYEIEILVPVKTEDKTENEVELTDQSEVRTNTSKEDKLETLGLTPTKVNLDKSFIRKVTNGKKTRTAHPTTPNIHHYLVSVKKTIVQSPGVKISSNQKGLHKKDNSNIHVATSQVYRASHIVSNKTLAKQEKPTTRRLLTEANFTAEPKWDFEEDYALDTKSTQTSCPISVKLKALNSSWLKESFLSQVRIFMDRRHFSDQKWEQLRHFKPPFGWMELNYTLVQEVISAIPPLSNQQILLSNDTKSPRCVSCAVVGNGGILNGSGLGKEIDGHDYVFRVNGAVIEGFEKDVGKRTSFYGFTAYSMLASTYLLNKKGFSNMPQDKETKYILFMEGLRDYEWLKAVQQNTTDAGSLRAYSKHARDPFGKSFDPNKLLVVHPDFVRYLKNRYLRSETLNGQYWKFYRPSTGSLVLLTALHLCDTVTAYGFMTHNYNQYSNHYYDINKVQFIFYINHDFILERDLWSRLHQENIIKLYQRL